MIVFTSLCDFVCLLPHTLQSEYAPILFAIKMVMMEVLSIDQHESQVMVTSISHMNSGSALQRGRVLESFRHFAVH